LAGNPVKKLTNTRQRTRMAHKHVRAFNLSRCPQCQSVKLPHRACPNCGYYRGREVVSKEEPAT
jgi:large subunit ribosomal protein L32